MKKPKVTINYRFGLFVCVPFFTCPDTGSILLANTNPANRDGTNQILPAACGDHSQRRAGRRQWYPIYDIEFKTDYGDYNFEVAIADGRIVGADYEVDEECLVTLGGSPVTVEEAAVIVAGKVPGADAADVSVWEESENGRDRCEGKLFFEDMKYEFEIDPQTGSNRRPYGYEKAFKPFLHDF